MPMPAPVLAGVNRQIALEFESSHVYLGLAAYFEDVDLPGFAHWMRLQAAEERNHALRLFDHLADRREAIQLLAVPQARTAFADVREAVAAAAEHERKVSAAIHALHALAGEHGDLPTQTHLIWFIDEQVEEERQSQDLLARLDHVLAGRGDLLQLDAELAARSTEA
jgi:ferritin